MSAPSSDVKWVRSKAPNYVLPPMPEVREPRVQASAVVVAVLSVACTLLAVFDMFLVAFGL